MEVIFEDRQQINLIETAEARKTGFSDAIIKSCRKRLNFIRNASDERDLREWKSLHYEEYDGQKSIRLNDQWRLFFLINNDCRPPRVTVLSIKDPH